MKLALIGALFTKCFFHIRRQFGLCPPDSFIHSIIHKSTLIRSAAQFKKAQVLRLRFPFIIRPLLPFVGQLLQNYFGATFLQIVPRTLKSAKNAITVFPHSNHVCYRSRSLRRTLPKRPKFRDAFQSDGSVSFQMGVAERPTRKV